MYLAQQVLEQWDPRMLKFQGLSPSCEILYDATRSPCILHTRKVGYMPAHLCVHAVANECPGRNRKGMARVILCALKSEIGVETTWSCPRFRRCGDRIPDVVGWISNCCDDLEETRYSTLANSTSDSNRWEGFSPKKSHVMYMGLNNNISAVSYN